MNEQIEANLWFYRVFPFARRDNTSNGDAFRLAAYRAMLARQKSI